MNKYQLKHETSEKRKNIRSIFDVIKKPLALIVCTTLIAAALAACGDDDASIDEDGDIQVEQPASSPPGEDENTPQEVPDEEFTAPEMELPPLLAENYDAALSTFPSDTVMISASGTSITWDELYVFTFSTVAGLTGYFSNPVDWNEVVAEGKTMAEQALEIITEQAVALLAYRYGANQLSATPDNSISEEINQMVDSFLGFYGSMDAFEESLRAEYGFYSFDTFERMVTTESLVRVLMVQLYGEGGTLISDEDAGEFASREGYLMAKHILIAKSEDAKDNTARERIDEIHAQLSARVGDVDFEDYFTELMLEESEDPGSVMSPNGYLFQPWDMAVEFSNATALLSEGEISDVVETSFGYHIILRIPINYDSIPIMAMQTGMNNSLRQFAAAEKFEALVSQWRDEMNAEFSAEFESIDLSNIFSWIGVN